MHTPLKNKHYRAAFTLTEVMISLAVLSLVIAASAMIYTTSIRIWRDTSARMQASSTASLALMRCTMGVGNGFGLRAAYLPVNIEENDDGWKINFSTPVGMAGNLTTNNSLIYNVAANTISYSSGNAEPTVIARHIVSSHVTRNASAINITVQAGPANGSTNITATMSTSITPRNQS